MTLGEQAFSLTAMNQPQTKILVTGGNRGIGRAIVAGLIAEGHSVVFSVRQQAQGQKCLHELKQEYPQAELDWIKGDFSSIASCYDFVERLQSTHPDINVLINNAGVWMTQKQLNVDGLEMSFMVNYLAPYILSTRLADMLCQNAPARIVNVNAGLYVKGKLYLAKTPYGKDFHKIKTYANTKLCAAMFTLSFAQRLSDLNLIVNAVHPGVINTGLGDFKGLLGLLLRLVKKTWKKAETGALAPIWLATSEEAAGFQGLYFNEMVPMDYNVWALDEKLRDELWQWTKELIAERLAI
ncbi:MAG: SDR family NAD(P)-dependent oxidoreductase [Bacteroidia bacterium]